MQIILACMEILLHIMGRLLLKIPDHSLSYLYHQFLLECFCIFDLLILVTYVEQQQSNLFQTEAHQAPQE
jgi:hypothetical protein